jgi:hypothetical protein
LGRSLDKKLEAELEKLLFEGGGRDVTTHLKKYEGKDVRQCSTEPASSND